jgi:hypothetical protein
MPPASDIARCKPGLAAAHPGLRQLRFPLDDCTIVSDRLGVPLELEVRQSTREQRCDVSGLARQRRVEDTRCTLVVVTPEVGLCAIVDVVGRIRAIAKSW